MYGITSIAIAIKGAIFNVYCLLEKLAINEVFFILMFAVAVLDTAISKPIVINILFKELVTPYGSFCVAFAVKASLYGLREQRENRP